VTASTGSTTSRKVSTARVGWDWSQSVQPSGVGAESTSANWIHTLRWELSRKALNRLVSTGTCSKETICRPYPSIAMPGLRKTSTKPAPPGSGTSISSRPTTSPQVCSPTW